MAPNPARDAFQMVDWIIFQRVQQYFDESGRPIVEVGDPASRPVQTEWQVCPYSGSRFHHAKPMNVSALRHISTVWEQVLMMLSWLSRRYRAWHGSEIENYVDLSIISSSGVHLADFLVLRRHMPVRSHEIPLVITGVYKACLGFQYATYLASTEERFAGAKASHGLPDAAEFQAYLEDHGLLFGEHEVCAGSAAQIMEVYDAMSGRLAVAPEPLPLECARLEIAWDQFDLFTRHASGLCHDLVLYAAEASRYCPELADRRLPQDVRHRLNACLKQHWEQLMAGQSGPVVSTARVTQNYGDRPTAGPPEPLEPPGQVAPPGSLAATVLAWLNEVAGDGMQTHGPVVASALQAQLAPYDLCEAKVLAGLNERVSYMMQALGLDRPDVALTASALSRVCGRTPRDWGIPVNTSGA
jgi:hypothetical protein